LLFGMHIFTKLRAGKTQQITQIFVWDWPSNFLHKWSCIIKKFCFKKMLAYLFIDDAWSKPQGINQRVRWLIVLTYFWMLSSWGGCGSLFVSVLHVFLLDKAFRE
jgi:hypothetical protein